jgi:hypothetical protein
MMLSDEPYVTKIPGALSTYLSYHTLTEVHIAYISQLHDIMQRYAKLSYSSADLSSTDVCSSVIDSSLIENYLIQQQRQQQS